MQSSHQKGRAVSFGPFEVDLQDGVLRKHGVKVKLQAQPFQILVALLEDPGAVITRDELRSRLWPENTFVEFEHGLNAAVARLRQALGDSAEQRRYIETVAKRGYRFTAHVHGDPPVLRASAEERVPVTVAAPREQRSLLWFLAAAVLVTAAGGFTFRWMPHPAAPKPLHPAPLTSFRGMEVNPALSPDGKYVAFAWNGEKQENFDIYVTPLSDAGAPVRLTSDPAEDASPVWSPDGRTVAFLRHQGESMSELFLVSATGGPEHKLSETRTQPWFAPRRPHALAWSPDGRWIAAVHREPGDRSEGIYGFGLNGEKRRLTDPPAAHRGDSMPAFSPDGKALAFCRLPGGFVSEIHVQPLDAEGRATGETRQVTDDKRWSAQPVWTQDGRSLLYVFGSDASKPQELRIRTVVGSPALAGTVPLRDAAAEIALGKHLVYARQIEDTNIWRARLPQAVGDPPAVAELFITSTRVDQTPKYSPDGRRIAFISSRTGSREVWVANADGSSPLRLTSFGGPVVGHPSWSPDGQWIVFHARPEGTTDLFIISAAGGPPRRLTTNDWEDHYPFYSRDGRSLFFSSRRSGEMEIWKMNSDGTSATQITRTGSAHNPSESPDGKTVFYHWLHDPGSIWGIPVQGGQPTKLIEPTHRFPVGFTVTPKGIYYGAPPHAGDERFVMLYDFATGRKTPVAVARQPFHSGMSVSPDARYILFDQYDESGSDLMVVENFQQP